MGTIIEELRQRLQLERGLIARLKTATIRFNDAQIERIWAINVSGQSSQPIKLVCRSAKSPARPE
jgi:hypothetical protein